jgi:hypothetical protein
MSRAEPAQLVPINDVQPSLFAGRKLRVAGTVTALASSTLLILSDLHPRTGHPPSSVLVDLSLCAVPSPPLKTPLMVLGTLTRRSTPIDLAFTTAPAPIPPIDAQVAATVFPLRTDIQLPSRLFVLEALVCKPLDHTFDLALWNHAARLRSHADWDMALNIAPHGS